MPSPNILSSERNDWQTPPAIIDLIERFNGGPIGLDPCGAPNNPTRAKANWYPPEHDGLDEGLLWPPGTDDNLVFVNPPFAGMSDWVERIVQEADDGSGTEVILLCVPRTDTAWFRKVWTASALAFWHGSGQKEDPLRTSRLRFVHPETGKPVNGNTNPSVFAYWGCRSLRFGRTFAPYARIIFP